MAVNDSDNQRSKSKGAKNRYISQQPTQHSSRVRTNPMASHNSNVQPRPRSATAPSTGVFASPSVRAPYRRTVEVPRYTDPMMESQKQSISRPNPRMQWADPNRRREWTDPQNAMGNRGQRRDWENPARTRQFSTNERETGGLQHLGPGTLIVLPCRCTS